MDLRQQLLLFAASLGVGVCFGVFYDLYRVINRRFGLAPWFTQVGDLATWVILGAAIFIMLQRISAGELRGFVLIGLGLGVLAYRGSIRTRVVRWLWVLVGAVARVLGWVWRLVSWPFRAIYRLIGFLFLRPLRTLVAWTKKHFFIFLRKKSRFFAGIIK
ncbi:MAG: hypothetical protein HPY50_17810 [Firmicutes bacterium]|nr:hypothetical protein [Bacillota bacterium]